jgi:hypothetical protein
LDDAIRRAVTEQLPAMRDSLTRLCTEGAWSSPARECMVHAADHAGLQACESQLSADQRATLDQPSAPPFGGAARSSEAGPIDDAQRSSRDETTSP